MTTRIKLPQVTLVAVSSVDIKAHEQALEFSCEKIDFGEVKLLDLNTKNIDEWNKAVIYELPKHIDTEYALLIHADGFVVNPDSWNDDWLNYDYIGSPWGLPTDDFSFKDINGVVQRVGNSVSLRSKKLLDIPNKLNLEWKPFHGYYNEDGFICVNYRHEYEKEGCKFAPFDVAVQFGRETPLLENLGVKPFVFHRYVGENSIYPRFK